MKKTFLALLLFIISLLIISCSHTSDTKDKISLTPSISVNIEKKDNWLAISMTKKDALKMTHSDFEKLLKSYIDKGDYLYSVIFFDDGTGIKFTSSEMGTYGQIDSDGVLSTVDGYIRKNKNGTYFYESESNIDTEVHETAQYTVSIDGFILCKNYENKDSVIINYTFTNNSTQPNSFATAINDKVFQNSKALYPTLVDDSKKYDDSNTLKDIDPNQSISCQNAYLLNDMSDVSIQLTDLLSDSSEIIAEKNFKLTK